MTFRARLLMKLAWLSNLSRYDWRQAVPHVSRGTHSGVPACCITFYVMEYLPWLNTAGTAHPHEAELRAAGLHRPKTEEELRLWMAGLVESDPPPHYIPCPDCLAVGRFVELHECMPECAGQPGATPPIPLELERRRRVAEAKAAKMRTEVEHGR